MYKLLLAIRYMLKRRFSYLAFGAVALCVFVVVVVMTVMTGMIGDFKRNNHAFVGDCVVGTDSLVGFSYYQDFMDILSNQDFIFAVSPVVKNNALISLTDSETNIGVEIMGIDPLRHSLATDWENSLHFKRDDIADAFQPIYDPDLAGCIIGIDLWMSRDPETGQYVYGSQPVRTALVVNCVPLTAKGVPAKSGTTLVNTKTFYNTDYSNTGLARVDGFTVYILLQDAQLLCGMDGPDPRISALHISFAPADDVEKGTREVAALWKDFKQSKADQPRANLLENVQVQTWKENRGSYIAAMEKEQIMLSFMFALVGLTTVFIVFVVFYMIVSHKTKDIGILKSLGAGSFSIVQLFLGFALVLGIVASATGAFLGWLFLLKINDIENWITETFGVSPLWDRSIYAVGEIPHQVDGSVLAIIVVCAVAACLIGAVVPTWQSARLKPARILQVNQL